MNITFIALYCSGFFASHISTAQGAVISLWYWRQTSWI